MARPNIVSYHVIMSQQHTPLALTLRQDAAGGAMLTKAGSATHPLLAWTRAQMPESVVLQRKQLLKVADNTMYSRLSATLQPARHEGHEGHCIGRHSTWTKHQTPLLVLLRTDCT